MYDAYFDDRGLIPEDRFCEVRFADLERDPLAVMRDVYDKLSLSGFSSFEPTLTSYVDSLALYQKNEFAPLDAPTRSRVATAWARSFERWGYPA